MNKDRNNNFGLLHFLAAIFVMYGHQFALLNRTSPIILGSLIQALGVKTIFLIIPELFIPFSFCEIIFFWNVIFRFSKKMSEFSVICNN